MIENPNKYLDERLASEKAKEQKKELCKFCDKLSFLKSIQKNRIENGKLINYRYTVAIVDEILVDKRPRGKTTHYTWLKIKYCPVCGKKINRKTKIEEGEL